MKAIQHLKSVINCEIITQLITSPRRQRDQAVRIPPKMGSGPKNSQFGNPPRNKAVGLQTHNTFLDTVPP